MHTIDSIDKMVKYKKNKSVSTFKILFLLALAVFIFFNLNPLSVKKSFADGNGSSACNGVYASNPIIYALYLKARGRAIDKNDVITYIKIVNPAKYKHDRNNVFLWNKLYSKDKARLHKLLRWVDSVKYFKNYIKASIGNYIMKKHGFYLMYRMKNKVIGNGMRTYRNIDFIKFKHGNIYYFFHRLAIVYKNAGKFNFLSVPPDKAEKFINKRTGTFGHIKKSVFLVYDFIPLSAKHNVLTVNVSCVKVYNNKSKSFLVGIIK
ncbi:MAG: DUF4852 domain-containing protein [Candidatus Acidulodesulfobacterium sp.]